MRRGSSFTPPLAWVRVTFAVIMLGASACVSAAPAAHDEPVHELEGFASWYGGKFQGRLTANGEVFDTNLLTAAHKTLPFGTVVEVTHLDNGASVRVRINDRGPFVEGRVIDLSRAAAEALSMTGEGVARVRIAIVERPPERMRVVQVGSFGVRENAVRLVARLASPKLDPQIEEADGVFRVVVRDVPESRVDEIVAELQSRGIESVLVRD
jgi:rare lipoprotein A